MAVAEYPSLKGMNSAMARILQFENKIVTINYESWLGLTPTQIIGVISTIKMKHKQLENISTPQDAAWQTPPPFSGKFLFHRGYINNQDETQATGKLSRTQLGIIQLSAAYSYGFGIINTHRKTSHIMEA